MDLSIYPEVSAWHPWRLADERRRQAVALWHENKLAEANELFLAVLKSTPEFPFTWSTYHRFLHCLSGNVGRSVDPVILVPKSDFFQSFQMYSFFDRCQVGRMVRARGWNSFEAPCPLVLARWFRAVGGLFCDVGASSGYYSLLALACGASDVIALDPYPPAVDVLRSNIELNGWVDRVDVRQVAASDSSGRTRLFLPLQTHELLETSASQDAAFRDQHSLEFDAVSQTLDSIVLDKLGSRALTIKIDIEGLDPTLRTLAGAGEVIRRHRPLIMMEYLSGPAEPLIKLLDEVDYSSVLCLADGNISEEERIAPHDAQPNHFLIPRELIPRFRSAICET